MEKEKKPFYKKWWFWVIIVIVILALFSGNSSNNPTDTSKTTLTSGETEQNISTNTEDTTSKQTKTSYNVGEIFENKNLAIKYVSLNDDFKDYNKYADVKSGYKVIKAEFEFENIGTSDKYVSSYDFNCYADGYDCESFWSVDDSTFSSQLSSGKKATGSVYFQVPIDANSIQLEYDIDSWTNEKVIFVVK